MLELLRQHSLPLKRFVTLLVSSFVCTVLFFLYIPGLGVNVSNFDEKFEALTKIPAPLLDFSMYGTNFTKYYLNGKLFEIVLNTDVNGEYKGGIEYGHLEKIYSKALSLKDLYTTNFTYSLTPKNIDVCQPPIICGLPDGKKPLVVIVPFPTVLSFSFVFLFFFLLIFGFMHSFLPAFTRYIFLGTQVSEIYKEYKKKRKNS